MSERRCSKCHQAGHYARTCGRPSDYRRPRMRGSMSREDITLRAAVKLLRKGADMLLAVNRFRAATEIKKYATKLEDQIVTREFAAEKIAS